MRIEDITREVTKDRVRLSARVLRPSAAKAIHTFFDFRVRDPEVVFTGAEPFAAATLVPAMSAAEPLAVSQPVSPQMCFQLPRIRDMLHLWYPHFARIPLGLVRGNPAPGRAQRALTCFSCGVDSFYTLLKYKAGDAALPARMTHVLFMRGVEVRQDDGLVSTDNTERSIRDVAAALGMECILGESNLRIAFEAPSRGKVGYEPHYFGSVLASHALALAAGFGYVCIPSAYSYNHVVPHGSSPVLDELYSTESLAVIHDGAEATRPMKVAKIIEWDKDLVLSHLRVCIRNGGDDYNCGTCYKCVRTAIVLQILGVFDQARTFRNRSMDHWERELRRDHGAMIEETLEFARERGAERKLLAMLSAEVRRRHRNDGFRRFVRNTSMAGFVPAFERMWRLAGRPV